MPADEVPAPLLVFSTLVAAYQHTHDDGDSQNHSGDYYQGGDGLLFLVGSPHGQAGFGRTPPHPGDSMVQPRLTKNCFKDSASQLECAQEPPGDLGKMQIAIQ